MAENKGIKGSLLAAGTLLLSGAVTLVNAGEYVTGAGLAVAGALCIGVREFVKE